MLRRAEHFGSSQCAGLQAWQSLTKRDKSMIRNMKRTLQSKDEVLVTELVSMEERGSKAEIEALYTVSGLSNFSAALAATLKEVCGE